MKYAIIFLSLLGCLSVMSCSKKETASLVPHTIKVTVIGTSAYSVAVSAIKANETTKSALDGKNVTTGTYEFTTSLTTGSVLHLDIQNSSGENAITYTITDNGAAGVSEANRELGSFSKISAEYTVK